MAQSLRVTSCVRRKAVLVFVLLANKAFHTSFFYYFYHKLIMPPAGLLSAQTRVHFNSHKKNTNNLTFKRKLIEKNNNNTRSHEGKKIHRTSTASEDTSASGTE